MEKVREQIQGRCLALYEALNFNERMFLMDYSTVICNKYNLGPWVRESIDNKGKKRFNRLSTHVKTSLKGGNIHSIQMFLECYNFVKNTNHTIQLNEAISKTQKEAKTRALYWRNRKESME